MKQLLKIFPVLGILGCADVLGGIDKSSYFRGDCGIINFKTKGDCEQSKTVKSSQFSFHDESKHDNTRMVSDCSTDKPVPWYPVILIKEKKGIDVKRCGGTYINKFWVITAGHCVCNDMLNCTTKETGELAPVYNFTDAFHVMLPSTHVPITEHKHFKVVEIVIHPKYKYNHAYDFALLRLDYPVADNLYGIGENSHFSDALRPICIPHPETIPDDIGKIATAVGMGNIKSSCITNEKGPEPFAPCATQWLQGNGGSRRQNRKKGRTRCSEGKYLPKQEEICRKLEKYWKDLRKSKTSDLSESDKKFLEKFDSDPDEIILVPNQDLSKTTGFNKTHCFLNGINGPKEWCGVCDTSIPKGAPGYCVDTLMKPSAVKGWGYCSEPCKKRKSGFSLGFAELTTLDTAVCKGLLNTNATSNLLTDDREMNFDENVEFCAAYLRTIKPPVVAYTITEDGKHEFVMANPVSPEIKSIRLENSVLKDSDMLLGGIDTCNGDSGGPLWLKTNDTYVDGKPQERAYLIGVTARGKDCAVRNLPGIYGRVKTVLEWIIENTNKTQIYKKRRSPLKDGVLQQVKVDEEREISPFWEDKLPEKKNKGKEGKKGKKKKKRKKKKRRSKRKSKKNKKKRRRKNKKGGKRSRKKNKKGERKGKKAGNWKEN